MNKYLLIAEKLTYFFKKKRFFRTSEKFLAINNLNFSIKPGKRIALLGRNGSGKSTLMKLMSGILIPDSGKIYIGGHFPTHFENRQSLGVLFGNRSQLWRTISVHNSLMMQAELYGIYSDQQRERITELIEAFEISEFLTRLPTALSRSAHSM